MSLRKLGLKWFGSLTNITFRRSTDKSDSKSGTAGGSANGDTTALDPVAESTVDDLDAMRPRTASYVRSSESYTHMGTLPRLLRKKKDKNNKEGSSTIKKTKEKSSLSRSQSQRPAGNQDHCPVKITDSLSRATRPGAELRTHTEPTPDFQPNAQTLHEATDQNTATDLQSEVPILEDLSPSSGSYADAQPETSNKLSINQTKHENVEREHKASTGSSQRNVLVKTEDDRGLTSISVKEQNKESNEGEKDADSKNR